MERNAEVINGELVIRLRPTDEERQLIEKVHRIGMVELRDARFDPKEEQLAGKCLTLAQHGFLKLLGEAWHLTYILGVNGYLLLDLPVPPDLEAE